MRYSGFWAEFFKRVKFVGLTGNAGKGLVVEMKVVRIDISKWWIAGMNVFSKCRTVEAVGDEEEKECKGGMSSSRGEGSEDLVSRARARASASQTRGAGAFR